MPFRPSLLLTLCLATLAAACLWLGLWQLDRAVFKSSQQQRYAEAETLDSLEPGVAAEPYTRVVLNGSFDPHRHILIDNRVLSGQPGVHVLTPFTQQGGGTTIMVNRGWLPMQVDRRALPAVPAATGILRINGHLEKLRMPGTTLGAPDQLQAGTWPQLVTYPDLGQISATMGVPTYPLVLHLAPESPGGFEGRHWKPYQMGPEKHRAYAVQWFALALAAVIIWLVLGRLRARQDAT